MWSDEGPILQICMELQLEVETEQTGFPLWSADLTGSSNKQSKSAVTQHPLVSSACHGVVGTSVRRR